jgi:hypothetical protein
VTADLIRRLQAAAAEHGTLDGTPPDRSLLLQEAADTLEAAVRVVNACYSLGAIMAGADSAEWVEIMEALTAYDQEVTS